MTERAAVEIDLDARVTAIVDRYRVPVVRAMREAIEGRRIEHARFMRYHLGWEDADGAPVDAAAGKMLRPALCMLACEAAGGDGERALPAAAAIELLHNFTLIHDDIEDGSDTRHGRTTLWRMAGIAQAINAGDGMFVLAQRTLLDMERCGVPAETTLEASRRLNEACVSLCEGQYADLSFESRRDVTAAEYEGMIRGKTGALVAASAAVGALAGGADPAGVDAFEQYGLALGLAFQIEDDVLGIWGDPAHTGKSVASDIRSRKKSYPVVYAFDNLPGEQRRQFAAVYERPQVDDHGLATTLRLLDAAGAREAAARAAEGWSAAAIDALDGLPLARERRDDLEALAKFAVHRRA